MQQLSPYLVSLALVLGPCVRLVSQISMLSLFLLLGFMLFSGMRARLCDLRAGETLHISPQGTEPRALRATLSATDRMLFHFLYILGCGGRSGLTWAPSPCYLPEPHHFHACLSCSRRWNTFESMASLSGYLGCKRKAQQRFPLIASLKSPQSITQVILASIAGYVLAILGFLDKKMQRVCLFVVPVIFIPHPCFSN